MEARIPFQSIRIIERGVLPPSNHAILHDLRLIFRHVVCNECLSALMYLEHCFDDLLGHKKDGVHAMMTLFCKRRTSCSPRDHLRLVRRLMEDPCVSFSGPFSIFSRKTWERPKKNGKMAVVRLRLLALCFSKVV